MDNTAYFHRLSPGRPGKPVFFAFHGTGGDENQFFDFSVALLPGATIVSPRGDVSERGAARFFRRTAEGVYDMDDLARATEKMAAFVASYKAGYPGSEVYGLGFSNGANILANLLFTHADLFDRAVLMHPLIPFKPPVQEASLKGKQVLVTAGRRDPICPVPVTESLIAYLQAEGAQVTAEWHRGGHEIGENEIEAVRSFLSDGADATA